MHERDAAAIEDCLYAFAHIEEYVEGISTAEDLMNFMVIGEAANRFSIAFITKRATVDWRSIIGFRNFVAHDYFGVDINMVWAAFKFHLPHLKKQLQNK